MKNKFYSLMSVVVAVFLSCLLYLTPAFAKDVDIWADDLFNFKNIKSVVFDNVSDFDDDLLQRKVNSCNIQTAGKAKMHVVSNDETMPDDAIRFTTTIERWDSSEQWHEPYTSWERRSATREKKDKYGKKTTETYYYDVPVHHPGYYSYWSHVQVRYDGYTKDNKLVYTHRESRNREESNAHFKMYERITKDYISRFSKYIKR